MTAERQTFPARTGALAEVTRFVETRAAVLGLPRQATLKLLLAAEELFINIVVHGYGGDCAEQVDISVCDAGNEVELVSEDRGPPFNPFAQLPVLSQAQDPDARPIGGLGRVLVAGLSSRHGYERRGACNRVTVFVVKAGEVR